MRFGIQSIVLCLLSSTTFVSCLPLPISTMCSDVSRTWTITDRIPQRLTSIQETLDLILKGDLPKSACCSYGTCVGDVNVSGGAMRRVWPRATTTTTSLSTINSLARLHYAQRWLFAGNAAMAVLFRLALHSSPLHSVASHRIKEDREEFIVFIGFIRSLLRFAWAGWRWRRDV